MRRTAAAVAAAGAALAAVLGAVSLPGWISPAAASTHRPDQSHPVYFRPVLCYAPAYRGTATGAAPLPVPACSPSSMLSHTNLGTNPDGNSPIGFTVNNVPPDAALAAVRTTPIADDTASATVLLSGQRGVAPVDPGERFVLGPAEMTSHAVAHAQASKNQTGVWVVDYSTTTAGAAVWNRVASENFHQVLAVDLDGSVVSAPIIEPTQSTFTSFNGLGEISGNLTRSEALRLARALESSTG